MDLHCRVVFDNTSLPEALDDSKESRRIKRTFSYEKLVRLRSGRFAFTHSSWTDASVKHGLGSGAFSFERPSQPHKWHYVECEEFTCSFRAEGTTIESLLDYLIDWFCPGLGEPPPRRKKKLRILIATDSLSFLQALETGPYHRHPQIRRCWEKLIKIANQGGFVTFAFVYAHCGVIGNELADQAADRASERIARAGLPSWITDLHRLNRQNLLPSFKSRKVILGEERSVSVRLARARCGESLEFGKFRRRIGLERVLSCRFCCPEAHTASNDQPPTPAAPAPTALVRSHDPVDCPICDQTFARLRNLQYHFSSKHPEATLPPEFRNHNTRGPSTRPGPKPTPKPSTPPICPHCNLPKPLAHHRLCPSRVTPKVPKPQLERGPGFPETWRHLTSECPALATAVRNSGVKPKYLNSKKGWERARCIRFLDVLADKGY